MTIPQGYSRSKTKGKVCKLKHALYDLKQSPRAQFGKVQKVMVSIEYKQSNADDNLFVKRLDTLIVYIDDIAVTKNDSNETNRLRTLLG